MKNLLRKLINCNTSVSDAFAQLISGKHRVDGNRFFIEKFALCYSSHDLKISEIARLNLLLPQDLKKSILHAIYPRTRESQGFPSYYDQCTPRDFRQLAQKHNPCVEKESFHYTSSYFSFFFPLYFLWHFWILIFHAISGEQAAETFCMALRKHL